MHDPSAASALRGYYRTYLESVDLTGAHPYGSPKERERFEAVTLKNGGLGCLVLDGIAQADLSAEQKRLAMSQVVASMVEFPAGKALERVFGDASSIIEPLLERTPLGPVGDWADAWIDGDEVKASAAVDGLVQAQLVRIKEEIARQGLPQLTDSDERRLRHELGDHYRDALQEALRQRGG